MGDGSKREGIGSVGSGTGRYILDKVIGRGGQAEVYLSHRGGVAGFNRKYVVKKILPEYAINETFVRRFVREASLVAQFHHPNIVEIYDLGATGDEYYIVMEYLNGRTLDVVIDTLKAIRRRCPPWIAARVIADAANALDYAHSFRGEDGRKRTIIHRDISPDNIMVTFTGQVKLLDFGVAKDTGATKLTKAGEIMGKPVYFAPESIKGKQPTPAWDIYSLGSVLYEAVTARAPFEQTGNTLQELTDLFDRILLEEPVAPKTYAPGLPQRLEEVILTAMDKKARRRFETAAQMRDSLEAYMSSVPQPTSTAALSQFMADLFKLTDHVGPSHETREIQVLPAEFTVPEEPPEYESRQRLSTDEDSTVIDQRAVASLEETVIRASPDFSEQTEEDYEGSTPARGAGLMFAFVLLLALGAGVGGAFAFTRGAVKEVAALEKITDAEGDVKVALAFPDAKPSPTAPVAVTVVCKAPLKLFVNQELAGKCPVEPLALVPGEHKLVVRGAARAREVKKTVTVEPGVPLQVEF